MDLGSEYDILYYDPCSRYTSPFATHLVNTFYFHLGQDLEDFNPYVTLYPKDHEVNPFEDHAMVRAYFWGEPVETIASKLKRNVKTIQLRLRLLLQIRTEVTLFEVDRDHQGIAQILAFFEKRADDFYVHCQKIVYGEEYVELMRGDIGEWGSVFDDCFLKT